MHEIYSSDGRTATAEPGVPDGDCVGGGSSASNLKGVLRDDMSGSASPASVKRRSEATSQCAMSARRQILQ
jgi:hypothetical protein